MCMQELVGYVRIRCGKVAGLATRLTHSRSAHPLQTDGDTQMHVVPELTAMSMDCETTLPQWTFSQSVPPRAPLSQPNHVPSAAFPLSHFPSRHSRIGVGSSSYGYGYTCNAGCLVACVACFTNGGSGVTSLCGSKSLINKDYLRLLEEMAQQPPGPGLSAATNCRRLPESRTDNFRH